MNRSWNKVIWYLEDVLAKTGVADSEKELMTRTRNIISKTIFTLVRWVLSDIWETRYWREEHLQHLSSRNCFVLHKFSFWWWNTSCNGIKLTKSQVNMTDMQHSNMVDRSSTIDLDQSFPAIFQFQALSLLLNQELSEGSNQRDKG